MHFENLKNPIFFSMKKLDKKNKKYYFINSIPAEPLLASLIPAGFSLLGKL